MSNDKGCPACLSLAAICLGTSATLMLWYPYRDNEGKFHSHNPNTHKTCFKCTECGTSYTEEWLESCTSCDYGKENN